MSCELKMESFVSCSACKLVLLAEDLPAVQLESLFEKACACSSCSSELCRIDIVCSREETNMCNTGKLANLAQY